MKSHCWFMYDCFCITMAELRSFNKDHSRVEELQQRLYGQENLKYLLSDPLQKSLPAPDFATKFHLI